MVTEVNYKITGFKPCYCDISRTTRDIGFKLMIVCINIIFDLIRFEVSRSKVIEVNS